MLAVGVGVGGYEGLKALAKAVVAMATAWWRLVAALAR